ncbi:MAG: phage holin, LLH family [Christensenellales bacterium]|jgi:hypothetical protein
MSSIGMYVIQALVVVLCGVLLRYGVPYIKALIAWEDLSYIKEWVDRLVRAAERVVSDSGLGEQRKAWVVEQLKGLNIVVDEGVDALIESAVWERDCLKEKPNGAFEPDADEKHLGERRD